MTTDLEERNQSQITLRNGQEIKARLNSKSTIVDVLRMFSTIEALIRPLNLSQDQLKLKAVEWHGMLQHMDSQSLLDAAREYAANPPRSWPIPWPTVADIKQHARDVRAALRAKLPQTYPTYREEGWRPPTPVEKARASLLAHAVRNRLDFAWYEAHMEKGEEHILAEADRCRALTKKPGERP